MRKIIKVTFIVALTSIAGYGIYNQNAKTVSDLMLTNIEALAWSEGSNSPYRVFPCPSSPGNECKTSNDPYRNECYSLSYCR